jgi:hypothetical protein
MSLPAEPVSPDPVVGLVVSDVPKSPDEGLVPASLEPMSPDPVFPVSVGVVVSPPVEFPESPVVEGVLPPLGTTIPCPFMTDSN